MVVIFALLLGCFSSDMGTLTSNKMSLGAFHFLPEA
jgi:hypothetical protein